MRRGLSGQPALARGADPPPPRVLPPAVGELVVAAVATAAENLEHVLAEAAVALRRRRGGGVHEFVSGRGRGQRLGAEVAAAIPPAPAVTPRSGENPLSAGDEAAAAIGAPLVRARRAATSRAIAQLDR